MLGAVEQIVFFAACRIHFDRLMLSVAPLFLSIYASSFGYWNYTSNDIDLHELTGFEAVGIAIAATGRFAFSNRVDAACVSTMPRFGAAGAAS